MDSENPNILIENNYFISNVHSTIEICSYILENIIKISTQKSKDNIYFSNFIIFINVLK
jgi:hypothetical protein